MSNVYKEMHDVVFLVGSGVRWRRRHCNPRHHAVIVAEIMNAKMCRWILIIGRKRSVRKPSWKMISRESGGLFVCLVLQNNIGRTIVAAAAAKAAFLLDAELSSEDLASVVDSSPVSSSSFPS